MTTRSAAISLALLLAPLSLPAAPSRASAEQRFCCPKTIFYKPKHPRIHYKCICPKNPCEVEHFGYYPTCWQPFPFPPDYSHCPVPPMPPLGPSNLTASPSDQAQLPPPSKVSPEPKLELPDKKTEPRPKQ